MSKIFWRNILFVALGIVLKMFLDEITQHPVSQSSENFRCCEHSIPSFGSHKTVLPRQNVAVSNGEKTYAPFVNNAAVFSGDKSADSGRKGIHPTSCSLQAARKESPFQPRHSEPIVENFEPMISKWKNHPMIARPPIFNGENQLKCASKAINKNCSFPGDMWKANRFKFCQNEKAKTNSDLFLKPRMKPTFNKNVSKSDPMSRKCFLLRKGFPSTTDRKTKTIFSSDREICSEWTENRKKNATKFPFRNSSAQQMTFPKKTTFQGRNFFVDQKNSVGVDISAARLSGRDNPHHMIRRMKHDLKPMSLIPTKTGFGKNFQNRSRLQESEKPEAADLRKKNVNAYFDESLAFRSSILNSINDSKKRMWDAQNESHMLRVW